MGTLSTHKAFDSLELSGETLGRRRQVIDEQLSALRRGLLNGTVCSEEALQFVTEVLRPAIYDHNQTLKGDLWSREKGNAERNLHTLIEIRREFERYNTVFTAADLESSQKFLQRLLERAYDSGFDLGSEKLTILITVPIDQDRIGEGAFGERSGYLIGERPPRQAIDRSNPDIAIARKIRESLELWQNVAEQPVGEAKAALLWNVLRRMGPNNRMDFASAYFLTSGRSLYQEIVDILTYLNNRQSRSADFFANSLLQVKQYLHSRHYPFNHRDPRSLVLIAPPIISDTLPRIRREIQHYLTS